MTFGAPVPFGMGWGVDRVGIGLGYLIPDIAVTDLAENLLPGNRQIGNQLGEGRLR